jgi:hypothetical protein
MSLEDPDGAENGGDAEATKSYQKLKGVAAKYNLTEIAFVNFLRRVYRNARPLKSFEQGPFLDGGSLVFNGANIRLAGDNGYYYSFWKTHEGLTVKPRTGLLSGSTHLSDVDQYEIQLNGAGVILVGKASYEGIGGGAHTWFQSEAHAASGSWGQSTMHLYSTVDHVAHGKKQVGAFGYCEYSEKEPKSNPLVVTDLPPYPYELTIVIQS